MIYIPKHTLLIPAGLCLALFCIALITPTTTHAQQLKPTQAIAQVPTEYNELFTIQWGGGSLYHLKARLATMGCMLNTIWVYDTDSWFSYNQYNVPQHLNQPFLNKFKDNIPPTTLQATCIDICTFDESIGQVIEGRECTTFEALKERGVLSEFEEILNLPIEQDTLCTNDFNPLVKEKVFELLPLIPDTCIVRQTTENTPNVQGRIGRYDYLNSVHFVLVWSNPSHFKSEQAKEALRVYTLETEIHELCHIQQEYYVGQQFKPYQSNHYTGWYFETKAYQKFMEATGFQEIREETQEGTYIDFKLPDNSIYKNIYSTNPVELSAELCTLYLLDKIGEQDNRYSLGTWSYADEFEETGYRVRRIDFDLSQYLTPEIVEWLETYMVLPDIQE